MRSQLEVRQQMFEMIEQWKQSGLSQKKFCQQQSIPTAGHTIWGAVQGNDYLLYLIIKVKSGTL